MVKATGKKIAVLGASLGGLVAAAELRSRGHEVTVVEKGRSVGGLYNKIATPFGTQELGMHVLYADSLHFRHLCDIFGEEVFHVLRGHLVDLGASANFGSVYFNSHYPSLLGHPLREKIMTEIMARAPAKEISRNARDEAIRRFGPTAADEIVLPIVAKLWGLDPNLLSRHALHCFFDLRRMVICDKAQSDRLKERPELDEVIANPLQAMPKGEVFGGRMGLTFKSEFGDLGERVANWAERAGVILRFNEDVSCRDGVLAFGDRVVSETFDACLVAVPVHALADAQVAEVDRAALSICYFQITEHIRNQFPSYYILAHDPAFRASRIVNYDAYNRENPQDQPSVIAIESVHDEGNAPSETELILELQRMIPSLAVAGTHRLERNVAVYAPTLKNAQFLDLFQNRIEENFGTKPVYFTGMRTDTGIFFSHHTIGLAYESALACHERLA